MKLPLTAVLLSFLAATALAAPAAVNPARPGAKATPHATTTQKPGTTAPDTGAGTGAGTGTGTGTGTGAGAGTGTGTGATGTGTEAPAEDALPPPSSSAQKVYSAAKADLLQIRMLLKSGRSQSSVGSGFMIGTSNLVVTNYHVVSQMAIDPDIYIGEWVDTDGKSGPLELLAVDVLHDLAVVRINRNGTGFFNVPEKPVKLTQGQYLYSLGNPLDLGFAISEGSYNGVIMRSFYDQLLFTGPINSGMSGGPSVAADGTVAGVNVSKRTDGELVSFLVPVKYVQELLARVARQPKPPKEFNPLIGQQLLTHQKSMIDKLLEQPLSIKTMGPYNVPVRESEQVRCWGRSNVKAEATFAADTISCAMESAIFISETQQTGQMSMSHQYVRSNKLDQVRFANLASTLFQVDSLGSNKDTRLTAPSCTEKFVKTRTLPLRAVMCVRAYRKFEGLYNFTLFTASTDDAYASLQSRLDLSGVSYENGMRTSRAFINALGRGGRK